MNFISEDSVEGVTISQRDAPPSHYIFKIQSFSSLLKNTVERYESGDFESGGYKWKLSLYPNGNKKKNVKDHISIYLVIADTSSLTFGWEVNVIFKLFLLNQIQDKYLTIEESGGRYRRFHGTKTELGFSHLIPHTTFNNPSNGYLVDETCVFGAEVFVSKNTGIGECLSMLKESAKFTYTWNVEKFSQLKDAYYYSEQFSVGEYKWMVKLYPKGDDAKGKNHISLYLALTDTTTLTPGVKVFVKYCMRIRNQIIGSNIEKEANHLFTKSSTNCGWPRFVSLDTFQDQTKGFFVKDRCIVEAEVTVLGLVSPLS